MDLQRLFQKVKIQSQLRSIAGVFFNSDRIEATNYKPSYQRNYVWDPDKASYFIESIFIGTDVPPLIYFQNEGKSEIIDGRQRYETILNFVQGKLRLRKSGMPKLGGLSDFAGKTFEDLKEEYKELFMKTRLRIIEFSFSRDEHTLEEEECLKHEIFQRYNTGITPLKSTDVEKAQYSEDNLMGVFKERMENEHTYMLLQNLFKFNKPSVEIFQHEFIELMVINIMPIKLYARETKAVIKRYFEFISSEADTNGMVIEVINDFFSKLQKIDFIRKVFEEYGIPYTRLHTECLFWGLSILSDEGIDFIPDDSVMAQMIPYFKDHSESFKISRSSFAKNIYERYNCIAEFFGKLYPKVDFNLKIDNNDDSKLKYKYITGTTKTMFVEFKNLHFNKQDATTSDVSDICYMVGNNKYLIRPSYQRREVITIKKASQIIESLLLDIKLPPIFVFYRKDRIYEVVDGQQRLLSILAFIGRPYKNENGEEEHSKIENFKLNLKDSILKEYHNKTFSELPLSEQRVLMNAGIWIAEINQESNPDFDPIDLFVRLNNKPYPIKPHTFEMWNSYINRYIIDTIKDINNRYKSWLYLRKTNNARMDNENLLAILTYLEYQKSHVPRSTWLEDGLYPEKTLDIYMAGEKISCRLKSKVDVTRFLEEDAEQAPLAINQLEFNFIGSLKCLLSLVKEDTSDLYKARSLDELMCVDNGKRTRQGFYILWLLLNDIKFISSKDDATEVFENVKGIFNILRLAHNKQLLIDSIVAFKIKYCTKEKKVQMAPVNGILKVCDGIEECDFTLNNKMPLGSTRFLSGDITTGNNCCIKVVRKPFRPGYIEALLCSKYFFLSQEKYSDLQSVLKSASFEIPYAPDSVQDVFEKLIGIIKNKDMDRAHILYLMEILDLAVYELYEPIICQESGIELITELQKDFSSDKSPSDYYHLWSQPNSLYRLYTYRSKDLTSYSSK